MPIPAAKTACIDDQQLLVSNSLPSVRWTLWIKFVFFDQLSLLSEHISFGLLFIQSIYSFCPSGLTILVLFKSLYFIKFIRRAIQILSWNKIAWNASTVAANLIVKFLPTFFDNLLLQRPNLQPPIVKILKIVITVKSAKLPKTLKE